MENNKSYKNNFRDAKYKQIAIAVKPADHKVIDDFCKSNGISKAKFIVSACRYCIDNGIDLNNEKE